MENSFSSWNDEDFVLEFSDDESMEHCESDDLKHNGIVNQEKGIFSYEERRINYFTSFVATEHPTEKQQKGSPDLSHDKDPDAMIGMSKLIDQLCNAKVVIERLPETRGREEKPEKSLKLPRTARLLDSVQRYCPNCKILKVDACQMSLIKSCKKCKGSMMYLCSKCNNKLYMNIRSLRRHWTKCGISK